MVKQDRVAFFNADALRTLKVNLDKLQLKKEKNTLKVNLYIHFIYIYIYMVSKNFKNTLNLTL